MYACALAACVGRDCNLDVHCAVSLYAIVLSLSALQCAVLHALVVLPAMHTASCKRLFRLQTSVTSEESYFGNARAIPVWDNADHSVGVTKHSSLEAAAEFVTGHWDLISDHVHSRVISACVVGSACPMIVVHTTILKETLWSSMPVKINPPDPLSMLWLFAVRSIAPGGVSSLLAYSSMCVPL